MAVGLLAALRGAVQGPTAHTDTTRPDVTKADQMNTSSRTTAPEAGARLFHSVLRPLQAFFRLEAASGLVLLAFAVAALVWANLAPAGYRFVFDAPLAIGVGSWVARFSLLELLNDGLMTVFFFVVGMEIKRELVVGELRSWPQAILPAIAAVGGMVVPAAIFLGFNAGGPGAHGWGIPMATDIAFCIGVLRLLERRVPRALVVFVTALAIFDDIGGILVIALFYGGGVHAGWLLASAAVLAAAFVMSRARVHGGLAWAVVGAILWYGLHHSGIHATIAGVLLGFAVPARPRRPCSDVLQELAAYAGGLSRSPADEERDASAIQSIEEHLGEIEAPLSRFVRVLHPWVAFGVMPLFALANSGVHVGGLAPSQLTGRVAVGTAVALFAGKQVGIFGFTLAAVKAGVARIPGDASVTKLLGVSVVAGIGFTVALFIAGLAYPEAPALLAEAKAGILAGSLVSGLVGAFVLRATPRTTPAADAVELEA